MHNDSLKSIAVKAGKYRDDDCKDKVDRTNKNLVVLSFFNFFQDTISVYVENKLVFKKAISKDTTVVSTDYTGFSYAVSLPFAKSNLSIISNNERVMVNTKIKRKYPVYLISLYNGVWYISPRKCFPSLK